MPSSTEPDSLPDHKLMMRYQEAFPGFCLPPVYSSLPAEWRERLVRALRTGRPDLELHQAGCAARELMRKGVRF